MMNLIAPFYDGGASFCDVYVFSFELLTVLLLGQVVILEP
jgi:hypothetical protein